jgi:hypothetical protein
LNAAVPKEIAPNLFKMARLKKGQWLLNFTITTGLRT